MTPNKYPRMESLVFKHSSESLPDPMLISSFAGRLEKTMFDTLIAGGNLFAALEQAELRDHRNAVLAAFGRKRNGTLTEEMRSDSSTWVEKRIR